MSARLARLLARVLVGLLPSAWLALLEREIVEAVIAQTLAAQGERLTIDRLILRRRIQEAEAHLRASVESWRREALLR